MKFLKKLFMTTALLWGQTSLAQDLSAGLVAHYPLDGNATDISGNGNDGTALSYTSRMDRWGKASSALAFDDTSDSRITVGSSASLPTGSFTINLWSLAGGILNEGTLIVKGLSFSISQVYFSDQMRYKIDLTTDQIDVVQVSFLEQLNPSFPVMITLRYDAGNSTYSVFYNDQLKLEDVLSNPLNQNTNDILIGNFLQGALDEIRVYDRVLTNSEIELLYQDIIYPDFTVSSPVIVNESATFTDASTSENPITSWEWDFEDDNSVDATVQNPTHTYPESQFYDVKLMISDGTNTRTIVKPSIVAVRAESPATELSSAEYFFDTDPGVGQGTSLAIAPSASIDQDFDISLAGLESGFHKLYVRVRDDKDDWSIYDGRTFYIQNSSAGSSATTITDAEYFFDTDPGIGAGSSIDVTEAASLDLEADIDLTGISTGFHKLYVRVQDDRNQWSIYDGRTFYIQNSTAGNTATAIVAAEFFFDTDPGVGNGTAVDLSVSAAEIDESLDLAITGLDEGDHTLNIRVQDDRGVWSIYQSADITVTNGPLSSDGFVTTDEDMSLDFDETDFNYSSGDGTTFTRVRINSLPLNGNLMLDGSGVSVNQEILVNDLPNFSYNPDTNVSGEDSFEFTVGDATELSVSFSVMTIDVLAVNDAPAFSLSGNVTVDQDFTSTQTVTVTPATVPTDEAGQVVSYSIDPASVAFANVSIDPSAGTVSITSVAGVSGMQEFTVTADDGGASNNTVSETFILTVTPANTAPVITAQTFSIDENSANGTAVGTVVASDGEQDAVTYAITAGNTNDAFTIDANTGALTVADGSQLDFETTPSFALTVEVADAEFSASAIIAVNLNDVDENTEPIIADQTFNIDENSANGTSVGTIEADDAEGDDLTYTITAGNTNDAFAIDASTGALTVADASQLDFETTPSFALTVEVADASLSASATITVNLNDVDENTAPTITDQTFSIDENSANGLSLGTVVASDAEQDALTYSITAGNTSNAFALDASTGALTVADATQLDFETTPSFELTVEVTDGTLIVSATITVNLNDVDENTGPIISDQTFSVDENSANGTEIGTVVASDAEQDALAYSITAGNAGDAFAIDATTGVLTVADASQLNFETTPSFALTVEVADASLSASALIIINLNDVDENTAPSFADQVFSVDENTANGTAVGTVEVTDAEGDAIFLTITRGNGAGGFALDDFGLLTVANSSVLDFETNPSFTLEVAASDGNLSTFAQITINLNDLDENPVGLPQVEGVVIYPNPVSGVFTLVLEDRSQLELIQLVGMDGKVIREFDETEESYNITSVQEGTYLVLAKIAGHLKVVGRLIKKDN